MQLFLNYLGAALLLALLITSPALDTITRFIWGERLIKRRNWRDMLMDLAFSEAGFVVTYYSKSANVGTTTAPTAIEANKLPVQVAQVFFTDAETQGIVVHNWGGLLGPSFATFLFPMVVMVKVLGAAADNSFGTQFTFGLANSNQVYITKQAGAAGGSFNVYMFLPHSIIGGMR